VLRGEIAGLRWSDVDLAAGMIVISLNRPRFGGQVVEGTVKSRASARVLPLPENLVATLSAARALQAADRLALEAAYEPSGYVVVDQADRPFGPHASIPTC
jgi:integrase